MLAVAVFAILVVLSLVLVVRALASSARSRRDRPARRMTVAERGEVVGLDYQDEHRAAKLADNVDIPLMLTYRKPNGQVSTRAVLVDGVYGETLGHPTYIRGLDSQSREERTFRTDRILAIGEGHEAIRENIPFVIGFMVREKAGLPELLPPQTVQLDRPVKLTVRARNRQVVEMSGRLVELTLRYEPQGEVWDGVLLRGDVADGRRARTKVQWGAARYPLNLVAEAHDGVTGELIENVGDWLRALAAER